MKSSPDESSFKDKFLDYADLMNLFIELKENLDELNLEQTESLSMDELAALDKKIELILDDHDLNTFRRLLGLAFTLDRHKNKLLSRYNKISNQNRLFRKHLSKQAKVQMLKDSGLSGARPSVDIEDFEIIRNTQNFELQGIKKQQAFVEAFKESNSYSPRKKDGDLHEAAKRRKTRMKDREKNLYDFWK